MEITDEYNAHGEPVASKSNLIRIFESGMTGRPRFVIDGFKGENNLFAKLSAQQQMDILLNAVRKDKSLTEEAARIRELIIGAVQSEHHLKTEGRFPELKETQDESVAA